MQRQPISVSLLAEYIKRIFDNESLLWDIEVIGEISSFNFSGGNAFFCIKDDGALLNCVLFGMNQTYIPKIGDKVIVKGSPKYYAKGGKLNFNATSISAFGDGELHKRFLELKNKLEKEGLFDVAHKKPMPQKINRIGVLTSETGAVIHDIINVATRRNSAQDIVLFPIKVQGIGADVEISKGINFFSDYDGIDAIIVGRGGGSDEDLQCFNSEIVAKAIYDCKKFVVSAVGHETDWTIYDFVADLRAPTPSAAAELLTKDGNESKQRLELLKNNISSVMQHRLSEKSFEISSIYGKIDSAMQNYMSTKQKNFDILTEKLNSANPKRILNLGYAKIESDGKVIDVAKKVECGQKLNIYFADGKVIATADEKAIDEVK